jgi:acyl carrier protein
MTAKILTKFCFSPPKKTKKGRFPRLVDGENHVKMGGLSFVLSATGVFTPQPIVRWRIVMPSKEDVFAGVRDALIEALAVEEDEVTPEATLVGDLGAESIDLLDIVSRLEKTFSIKIDRGELVPDDIVNDTQGKYVVDGKLTAQGLSEIKKRMPYTDLSSFEANPMIQNFPTILTVKDMCYLVEQKLGI